MIEISRYKKYKESYQAYHLKNRDSILERQRNWRLNHPEYSQDSSRNYRKDHKDLRNKANRKWRKIHIKKKRAGNMISRNLEKYPLNDECEFCGDTEKLEHGHIDYAYPELYLTVCHRCNYWMDIRIVTET